MLQRVGEMRQGRLPVRVFRSNHIQLEPPIPGRPQPGYFTNFWHQRRRAPV